MSSTKSTYAVVWKLSIFVDENKCSVMVVLFPNTMRGSTAKTSGPSAKMVDKRHLNEVFKGPRGGQYIIKEIRSSPCTKGSGRSNLIASGSGKQLDLKFKFKFKKCYNTSATSVNIVVDEVNRLDISSPKRVRIYESDSSTSMSSEEAIKAPSTVSATAAETIKSS